MDWIITLYTNPHIKNTDSKNVYRDWNHTSAQHIQSFDPHTGKETYTENLIHAKVNIHIYLIIDCEYERYFHRLDA